jgi:hypothetical protein
MTERDGSKARASAICIDRADLVGDDSCNCLKKRLAGAYFGSKMQGEEGT